MSIEVPAGAARFPDRRHARLFFSDRQPGELHDTVGIAWRDAAHVAPELFFTEAARSITNAHLGSEGMPHPDAAMRAFFDLAYIWRECRNASSSKHKATQLELAGPASIDTVNRVAEDYQHLAGTRLELLFAAALCGARASGVPMVARLSPGYKDFGGGEHASDLELHTPDGDYSLQIKSGNIDERCFKYDLDSVVVVSLPLFVQYLGAPGNTPEDQLIPFKAPLAQVAGLSELIADGYDEAEFHEVLDETLIRMEIFSSALQRYIDDRPDIAILQDLVTQNYQEKTPA